MSRRASHQAGSPALAPEGSKKNNCRPGPSPPVLQCSCLPCEAHTLAATLAKPPQPSWSASQPAFLYTLLRTGWVVVWVAVAEVHAYTELVVLHAAARNVRHPRRQLLRRAGIQVNSS